MDTHRRITFPSLGSTPVSTVPAMAKNKERNLKKDFNYEENTGEYNLQLKKKPNLWWLLLLLLPLVLLIPLRKDVTVYTQLDGQAEPYVDVKMDYKMKNICGVNEVTVIMTATAVKY